MPRRNFAEVLIGAVVLLVAAGFLAYAIAHSGRSTGSGYQLYARFDHIDGLSIGGDVRVAGVKVGTIDSATLDPKTYQAVVGISVRDDLKLPKDSSAVITSESLLGGKYLALTPGGDDTMLQPGQTITITQGSINIEDLLGKFIFSASSLTSGGGKGGESKGDQGKGDQGKGDRDGGSGGGAAGGGLPPLGSPPSSQTSSPPVGQTSSPPVGQTSSQTGGQTSSQTGGQTGGQTGSQTGGPAGGKSP